MRHSSSLQPIRKVLDAGQLLKRLQHGVGHKRVRDGLGACRAYGIAVEASCQDAHGQAYDVGMAHRIIFNVLFILRAVAIAVAPLRRILLRPMLWD